jgi:amino acid adenylation domain-containing protein
VISSTLHEGFERQAVEFPDAIALRFNGNELSYGELNRRSNRLAAYLRDSGVGPEVRVGVCLERGFDVVAAILAVLKAGGAYVPMDPIYPPERLRFIVDDSACSIILTSRDHVAQFAGSATTPAIEMDGDQRPWDALSPENLPPLADSASLAYVIYTSGSTGLPKGVLIPHKNVLSLFTSTNSLFGFSNKDVWSFFHSYAFDFSVWEIWGALLYGGRIVVVSHATSRSPEEFYRLLANEGVTVLSQTPSAFRQLQHYEDTLSDARASALVLRYVVFGGEALDFPSLRSWMDRHGDERPQLINMYGITETTVHVTYRRIRTEDTTPGTPRFIGTTIPSWKIYVLDEHGKQTGQGQVGEMYVGGAGVAHGYLNRPDLTAERFVHNPLSNGETNEIVYRTGDLAKVWANELEYMGRNDSQVQLRGFRIELGEIESKLSSSDGVRNAVVRLHRSSGGDERLVAYYEAASPIQATLLRRELSRTLPEYMIPSAFVHVSRMPLTENGKLDYGALPTPDFRSADDTTYVAPTTKLEKEIAEIWQRLLGVSRVGLDEDFYDLGGHSLLAFQLSSRIRERFDIRLPISRILSGITVRACTQAIGNADDALSRVAADHRRLRESQSEGKWPLSYSQLQLWLLDQMHPGISAYNCAFAVFVEGLSDASAIAKSLNKLVQRHDILRSTYCEVEGEPFQTISPYSRFPIAVTDIDYANIDEWKTAVMEGVSRAAKLPFSLSMGPLYRFDIYRSHTGDLAIGVNFHHIVIDALSMHLVVKQLAEYCQALSAHSEIELERATTQYAEFVSWQRDCSSRNRWKSELEYWRDRLLGLAGGFELPTDFPRPHTRRFQGDTVQILLPKEISRSLRRLSRTFRVTITSTVLAIWKVLFFRLTEKEDVAIGSTCAARSESHFEDIVGFLVNTVILRTSLAGNPRFSEALMRVVETATEAYDHQALPFERLVAELLSERDASETPLFHVLFAGQHRLETPVQASEISFRTVEVHNETSKFDATISFFETDDNLKFVIEYDTDLFGRSTMETLLHCWEVVAQSVAHDPEQEIGRIPLLSTADQSRIMRQWCGARFDYPLSLTLHGLFQRSAQRFPNATAVIDDGRHLSYQELDLLSSEIAIGIRQVVVGTASPIGLYVQRSAEMLAAVLGILKTGCACLPLSPDYPRNRLAYICKDSGVSVIVTQLPLATELEKLPGRKLYVDELVERNGAGYSHERNDATDTDPLAYVLYTSGSTGIPKGVAMPHRAIVNLVHWQRKNSRATLGTRTLQFSPLSFDVSFQEMFTTWDSGGTLVLIGEEERRDPNLLIGVLRDEQVNRLFLPFVALQELAEAVARERKPDLMLTEVITAGERLRVTRSIRELFRLLPGCLLINQYGPTESHVVSAFTMQGPVDEWPSLPPIGRPIDNVILAILDSNLEIVPEGFPGELCIGGAGLARGYWKSSEEDFSKFLLSPFRAVTGERLYRTGDIARYVSSGDIEFLGRSDHQIKVRGHRVEPGEVEVVLNSHPDVRECAVVAKNIGDSSDGSRNVCLVAYFRLREYPSLPEPHGSTLRVYLAERLPGYMIPSYMVKVDSLPLTPSGKLDTSALPPPAAEAHSESEQIPLDSEIEHHIAKIWVSLLGLDSIGPSDDFFLLGGHSLLAVRLVTRLSEDFNIKVPVLTVFQAPTLRELAEEVEHLILDSIEQQFVDEAVPNGQGSNDNG